MHDNQINGKDILLRLEDLLVEGRKEFEQEMTPDKFNEAKAKYIGRKGEINKIMKLMGSLDAEYKPKVGQLANKVRNELQDLIKNKENASSKKKSSGIDLTLPGKRFTNIGNHPFHAAMQDIVNIFISMGFDIVDGPDVDTEENNFDALNTPDNHPSRSEEDTFYLNEPGLLMRTQTSPVQIRVMKSTEPPVKIIAPGRCYRRDTVDATHYFSFTQVEGLYVDKNVSMSDLKGVLTNFAKRIMGDKARIRFRPHFFPFTEPSVEYDFSCLCDGDPACRICKGSGWIEISGAGMVDPNVLRNVGYDPEVWSGYAFGMGVERIVMIKYGISDIRMLYENDLRMIEQF